MRTFLLYIISTLGLFAVSDEGVFFMSKNDVLEAYEGTWVGSEDLFLKGRLVANMEIEHENRFIEMGFLNCSTKASVSGENIESNATIMILENKLYLNLRGADSKDILYEGFIKANAVEWFRVQKIFPYEYTKDIFLKKANIRTIQTYSVKPHSIKGGQLIYLEHRGTISKYKSQD